MFLFNNNSWILKISLTIKLIFLCCISCLLDLFTAEKKDNLYRWSKPLGRDHMAIKKALLDSHLNFGPRGWPNVPQNVTQRFCSLCSCPKSWGTVTSSKGHLELALISLVFTHIYVHERKTFCYSLKKVSQSNALLLSR